MAIMASDMMDSDVLCRQGARDFASRLLPDCIGSRAYSGVVSRGASPC